MGAFSSKSMNDPQVVADGFAQFWTVLTSYHPEAGSERGDWERHTGAVETALTAVWPKLGRQQRQKAERTLESLLGLVEEDEGTSCLHGFITTVGSIPPWTSEIMDPIMDPCYTNLDYMHHLIREVEISVPTQAGTAWCKHFRIFVDDEWARWSLFDERYSQMRRAHVGQEVQLIVESVHQFKAEYQSGHRRLPQLVEDTTGDFEVIGPLYREYKNQERRRAGGGAGPSSANDRTHSLGHAPAGPLLSSRQAHIYSSI
ncbi:hypothetical protein JCM11641_004313 [Rhodosporidiobolus odoratus]